MSVDGQDEAPCVRIVILLKALRKYNQHIRIFDFIETEETNYNVFQNEDETKYKHLIREEMRKLKRRAPGVDLRDVQTALNRDFQAVEETQRREGSRS